LLSFDGMWNQPARKAILVLGLGACLLSSGCAAAGELGMRAAVGLLEAMLAPSPGGSSSSGGSSEESSAERERIERERDAEMGETPCRKRLHAWQKAVASSGEDAPAHLRCKPDGDWPDEESLRRTVSSGF
jgi:hypothetical protein